MNKVPEIVNIFITYTHHSKQLHIMKEIYCIYNIRCYSNALIQLQHLGLAIFFRPAITRNEAISPNDFS